MAKSEESSRRLEQLWKSQKDLIPEEEVPTIRRRIGVTVFGKLKPKTAGSPVEIVAFLRERPDLIPETPGLRMRMDRAGIYAPTGEWVSGKLSLFDDQSSLAVSALTRQLGITMGYCSGRWGTLFKNKVYEHGEGLPYQATHYAIFLRTQSAVRLFLKAIRLPISSGNLFAISEEEILKHTNRINQEISDLLDAGFARMNPK